MTPKQWLSQYKRINARMESKLEEIERLRALAERCTAAYGEHVPGGTSDPDRRATIVARIVEMQSQLEAESAELLETQKAIQDAIRNVGDDRMQLLLEMRYIRGESWVKISRALNYEERNTYYLHGAALKRIHPPEKKS